MKKYVWAIVLALVVVGYLIWRYGSKSIMSLSNQNNFASAADSGRNPTPGNGILALAISPSSGSILLWSKGSTPEYVSPGNINLPAGDYNWQASADGYNQQSGTVTVTAGKTTSFNIALSPIGSPSNQVMSISGYVTDALTGYLLIGAQISLDGGIMQIVGNDGSYTFTNVTPGNHQIIASMNGYQTYNETIFVTANSITDHIIVLQRLPAPTWDNSSVTIQITDGKIDSISPQGALILEYYASSQVPFSLVPGLPVCQDAGVDLKIDVQDVDGNWVTIFSTSAAVWNSFGINPANIAPPSNKQAGAKFYIDLTALSPDKFPLGYDYPYQFTVQWKGGTDDYGVYHPAQSAARFTGSMAINIDGSIDVSTNPPSHPAEPLTQQQLDAARKVLYSNPKAWIGAQLYSTYYCAVYYQCDVTNPSQFTVQKQYHLYKLMTKNGAWADGTPLPVPDNNARVALPATVNISLQPGETKKVMVPPQELIPNTQYGFGEPWRIASNGLPVQFQHDYFLVDELGLETPHVNLNC